MTRSKYFYITLGISIFFGLLPTIAFIVAHGFLPHIPLEIADDTLYYFTRIHEVLKGHMFVGNSYLFEHVHDLTPAFFVADWIYALPFAILGFIGFSFNTGIIVSHIIWVSVTAFLVYLLYGEVGMPEKYRPYGTALILICIEWLLIRPVTMSVVYPSFLLFLLAMLQWVHHPERKREQLWLMLASAWSFYVYTYLWQIALVSLGILSLRALYHKEHRAGLAQVLAGAFIIATPVFVYTWKQLHSPFYFETLKRVGLVNTHLIGGTAVLYAAVTFLLFGILYMLRKQEYINARDGIFFTTVFAALLITLISNVVSGKDLELASHVGRFIDVVVVFFFSYSSYLYSAHCPSKKVLMLLLCLFGFTISLAAATELRLSIALADRGNKETYIGPIEELKRLSPGVVLADDDLSSYVPFLTNDYVLFHPNAELYLASNTEIEERYLVSRMFDSLDEDQIKTDFRKYGGVGNAVHEANVHNRAAKICSIIRRMYSRLTCDDSRVTSFSLQGEEYFSNLMNEYIYIQNHKEEFLKKYNVQYIVTNHEEDIQNIQNEVIWQNENFKIYKVK